MAEATASWRVAATMTATDGGAHVYGEPEPDPDPPEEVVAEDGRAWHVGRKIGRGGQGSVYELEAGPLVVKLLDLRRRDGEAAPDARDEARREALRTRLAAVQRLPLDGLPIARPLAQLRAPEVGYVMRLVDDVGPLVKLSEPAADVNETRWYAQTGGVRRRLRLLARLADVLDRLHGQAIVYGDLSPTNVLVSTSAAHDEVWLIDPDNLRYTDVEGDWICTKDYGAPELQARGHSSPTTLTDAHALAVVVFKTLTGGHPLLGGVLVHDDVDQTDPALTGALPWTDHPQRHENARVHGMPAEAVMTPQLLALARETFEEGLLEPTRRARAGAWAAELAWAADLCVTCSACEQTYVTARTPACPFCAAPRPRLALASIAVCDEDGGVYVNRHSPHIVAREGELLRLTRRHAFGERDVATQHELAATLRLTGERALFEPAVAGTSLADRSGIRPLVPGEHVELPASPIGAEMWAIHFGEPGTLHRLARLQAVPEVRP